MAKGEGAEQKSRGKGLKHSAGAARANAERARPGFPLNARSNRQLSHPMLALRFSPDIPSRFRQSSSRFSIRCDLVDKIIVIGLGSSV
jgi:hypothetical protein